MKKLKPYDLTPVSGNAITDITLRFLSNFVKYKKINELYKEHSEQAAKEFIDNILEELSLDYIIEERDLQNIPKKNSFVGVSNFPLGGVEAFILYKIFSQVRDDIKIIVSDKFHKIKPLDEITLPLPDKHSINSLGYLRRIYSHLRNGGGIIVFPARIPARYKPSANLIADPQWDVDIIRLIRAAGEPVLPIFVNNQNSFLYHILGILHPLFQAMFLEKEIKKSGTKQVQVRIGKLIKPEVIRQFDSPTAARYLRARTYALGNHIEVSHYVFPKLKKEKKKEFKFEPIAPPIDKAVIKKQIEEAKKDYLQFTLNDMDVIVAPTYVIPDVLTEIGRLREITFRSVDEGSGRSLDLDEYDLYYYHLIIWDRKEEKIVGAYRLGKGDEILDKFGVEGFYTASLFIYKSGFEDVLRRSLELGRSFIVPEYQRRALPLFLLWKGILYFLLKNINYQYLIGPVTISDKFSEVSKTLIVKFFQKYYHDEEFSKYIRCRMEYKPKVKGFDADIILRELNGDINKLDNIIKEIENGLRLPVLYKKYISLGAKVTKFNVDPDFNYCVDGLMILDLYNVPLETVYSLAKELNANQLLERFASE